VRDHHCLYVHGQDTGAWCHECFADWHEFKSDCGQHATWAAAMEAYTRCVVDHCDEETTPPPPPAVEIHIAPGLSVILPGWHAAYEAAQRSGRN
jgi:hypothetical protein